MEKTKEKYPIDLGADVEKWLDDTIQKTEEKVFVEVERNQGVIPYIPENGRYTDKGADRLVWWTNSFWSGMMWQLYNYTGKEEYRQTAEAVEERLDGALESFEGLHHDVGFQWLHTSVAHYRHNGNPDSRRRALHAATLLAGRFNPVAQYIRSWNHHFTGWAIIDCMMNTPLLYWASEELNDPRFAYIANQHADKVMHNHVRPDGSVNHIVDFDPHTGEAIQTLGGQGYGEGSSWTRGQAWALYGFALSYKHTKNDAYLDTAKRVAHYFIANARLTDFVPLVDFRAPKEPVQYDTTAGMIAACGLLEIVEHVPEFEKEMYLDPAIKMLQSTVEKFANWDLAEDGIIGGGTASYHEEKDTHVPIIYGDYFFIEAVLRLKNEDTFLW